MLRIWKIFCTFRSDSAVRGRTRTALPGGQTARRGGPGPHPHAEKDPQIHAPGPACRASSTVAPPRTVLHPGHSGAHPPGGRATGRPHPGHGALDRPHPPGLSAPPHRHRNPARGAGRHAALVRTSGPRRQSGTAAAPPDRHPPPPARRHTHRLRRLARRLEPPGGNRLVLARRNDRPPHKGDLRRIGASGRRRCRAHDAPHPETGGVPYGYRRSAVADRHRQPPPRRRRLPPAERAGSLAARHTPRRRQGRGCPHRPRKLSRFGPLGSSRQRVLRLPHACGRTRRTTRNGPCGRRSVAGGPPHGRSRPGGRRRSGYRAVGDPHRPDRTARQPRTICHCGPPPHSGIRPCGHRRYGFRHRNRLAPFVRGAAGRTDPQHAFRRTVGIHRRGAVRIARPLPRRRGAHRPEDRHHAVEPPGRCESRGRHPRPGPGHPADGRPDGRCRDAGRRSVCSHSRPRRAARQADRRIAATRRDPCRHPPPASGRHLARAPRTAGRRSRQTAARPGRRGARCAARRYAPADELPPCAASRHGTAAPDRHPRAHHAPGRRPLATGADHRLDGTRGRHGTALPLGNVRRRTQGVRGPATVSRSAASCRPTRSADST